MEAARKNPKFNPLESNQVAIKSAPNRSGSRLFRLNSTHCHPYFECLNDCPGRSMRWETKSMEVKIQPNEHQGGEFLVITVTSGNSQLMGLCHWLTCLAMGRASSIAQCQEVVFHPGMKKITKITSRCEIIVFFLHFSSCCQARDFTDRWKRDSVFSFLVLPNLC